jgi:predicted permease
MDQFRQNIRFGLRQLWRNPGFATIAIATLGLGIGANTAIFSVLDGVVLAPLPYRAPDRLVIVSLFNRSLGYPTYLSYPDFLDWRRTSRSFERMAAYRPEGFDLTRQGAAEHVDGNEVSSTFFDTLGVKLALGREFSPEEDQTDGAPVAIISDHLWKAHFAASASVIGKPITLNGVDYTMVGVLSAGFRFGEQRADVFTPIGRGDPLIRNDRSIHNIATVARLKPEVSIGQAQAEMNTVQDHIDELNPATERGLGTYIVSLKEFFIGDLGGTLLLLLGAVGLVLLIACANVANLLLVRSVARTKEFAVRLALGASRGQIVRQLVSESVLLALLGGALGLAIAKWGLSGVRAAVPELPRIDNIGLNHWVLLFALVMSTVVGILFGVLPALKSSKADVQAGLKVAGRGSAGGQHRTQDTLVVVQIALALVLLAGGSLLYRTIQNLWAVNPGFDTRHVVSFQVGLSPSFDTASKVRAAYQQLAERIRRIPGVEAAEITALLPLGHQDNSGPFWIGSRQPASLAEIPRAVYYPSGADYLRTMQIPLLRGRTLSPSDEVHSQVVVLIDSLLARTYFPGRDAVGQTLTIPNWGAARNIPARIVGVVGHVEQYGLDGALREKPQIYFSLYQLPDEVVPTFRHEVMLVVRTPGSAASIMPAIRSAVQQTGSDQPVYNVRTMRELVSESMAGYRFPMILLSAFASLALVLACVGIYGVISYSMSQRVRELGIRIALGALKRDVLRMVLGQSLRLALAGVAIGAVAAFTLTRFLSSFSHLLFGVRASDPVTFLAVSALLVGAALAACYVPARRAARMDPMAALRQE